MAFTYLDSDLATTTGISRLRFNVGDTEERLALLTDGEATYLIGVHGTADAATIPAVDVMIRKQSQRYSSSSGAEREEQSQRLANLRQLRADLVAQGYTDSSNTSLATVTTLTRRDYEDSDTEYSS